ncbi:MAG: DUF4405 domain-containing protein [Chlorobiaceae bacterium]|nr:DUF4405 domain-containing protein [Chlorobiaceae bacterium]
MSTSLKTWATPIAIGSFVISAVTGILIFFDIEIGAVEPVHRWLSWLLLGGITLHALSNRKPFTAYFSRKPALAVMGLALAVAVASMLPVFGEDEEAGGKRAGKAAAHALESAPLATVALVVKAPSAELVARLGARGIKVEDPSRSIAEIARMNGKEGGEVLGAVLGGQGEDAEAH